MAVARRAGGRPLRPPPGLSFSTVGQDLIEAALSELMPRIEGFAAGRAATRLPSTASDMLDAHWAFLDAEAGAKWRCDPPISDLPATEALLTAIMVAQPPPKTKSAAAESQAASAAPALTASPATATLASTLTQPEVATTLSTEAAATTLDDMPTATAAASDLATDDTATEMQQTLTSSAPSTATETDTSKSAAATGTSDSPTEAASDPLQRDRLNVIVRRYAPGQRLKWHKDSIGLFEEPVYGVVLRAASPSVGLPPGAGCLEFKHGSDRFIVPEVPGLASLQTGQSRFSWAHGVESAGGGGRVTVTWRWFRHSHVRWRAVDGDGGPASCLPLEKPTRRSWVQNFLGCATAFSIRRELQDSFLLGMDEWREDSTPWIFRSKNEACGPGLTHSKLKAFRRNLATRSADVLQRCQASAEAAKNADKAMPRGHSGPGLDARILPLLQLWEAAEPRAADEAPAPEAAEGDEDELDEETAMELDAMRAMGLPVAFAANVPSEQDWPSGLPRPPPPPAPTAQVHQGFHWQVQEMQLQQARQQQMQIQQQMHQQQIQVQQHQQQQQQQQQLQIQQQHMQMQQLQPQQQQHLQMHTLQQPVDPKIQQQSMQAQMQQVQMHVQQQVEHQKQQQMLQQQQPMQQLMHQQPCQTGVALTTQLLHPAAALESERPDCNEPHLKMMRTGS
ncbi:unnamed protein product [Polarella glacialis]|uniref:Uncharacterized protein n=1 Tax=Polarella glacialis TaxID=89957 RepID=A0A813FKH0_POLGL|nr:unnamed protein product [Polarella glacialis]